MPPPSPRTLRLINLAESLREEVTARLGLSEDEALTDPPGELAEWTEAAVRAHYATLGPPTPASKSQPTTRLAPPPPPLPDHPAFAAWVPGLPASRTAVGPPASPAARIVAFPCAGSAEDMYSLEGTGSRWVASPLLDWCRANNVELLAVQPPGRAARSSEPPITRAAALAAAALPALAPRLAGPVPWFLLGHSAGAWVGYEFALAARRANLPAPRRAFLSAMLPPDTPATRRPWRKSHGLSTPDLQAECRAWGMAGAALSPGVWPAFEPLIRADFQLFDEYEWRGGGDDGGRLACPLTVFAGTDDGRCPAGALTGWARLAPSFELVSIPGPHLWPLDRGCKPGWLAAIAARAAADLSLPGPVDGWGGGGRSV